MTDVEPCPAVDAAWGVVVSCRKRAGHIGPHYADDPRDPEMGIAWDQDVEPPEVSS
jgi:hypothetical protein